MLRHAKAITGKLNMPDQDRPLSERGFKDAARLGERIHKKGIHFDLILSSSAIRAITTAQLIINRLDLKNSNILIDPKVYQASDQEILGLISLFHKKYDHLLLIGHNPSLAVLASHFAGESVAMPTCSLARVLFEFKDWQKIVKDKSSKFNFIN